ncbi:hypothetical protein [Clostridium sp. AF32-12BH]|uniref:SF0329 family protein n=1 Tax=Clostridium sp. AF32-12BH TaxID=2292006 RepID=UPI000E4CAEC4|nr:hypothetical protein [Clostridium sp. AF32-12BH]RHP47222.1 hypothetical protein DWZ40_07235 [Clostridium sp. AF32-12BH]
MSKRWSKLQKRLYNLMDPKINFQIHCALYEMNSNDGYHGNKLPRYFITIGKKIVFDYPKDFDTNKSYESTAYPWLTDMSEISDVIEEYIQCPESGILHDFEDDKWEITEILRVCDRRIGKRRLRELENTITNEVLLEIIERRIHTG